MRPPNYDNDEARMRQWNRPLIVERAASELQGMAAAVIYDGVVENDEIIMLYRWLDQYKEESNEWPLNELKKLIEDICADGIVTTEERMQLFRFLKNFATGPDEEAIVGGIFDDVQVVIPEHVFMFTGKLCYGPRKKAQEAILSLGGELAASNAVTQGIDYLVCGDLGNVNFRQSRYGNKIAKALELRDEKKTGLYIVKESAFVEAIVC